MKIDVRPRTAINFAQQGMQKSVDALKCEDYIQDVDDCIRNKKQIRCSNFFSYKCAKKDDSKNPNENISEDL